MHGYRDAPESLEGRYIGHTTTRTSKNGARSIRLPEPSRALHTLKIPQNCALAMDFVVKVGNRKKSSSIFLDGLKIIFL
jgi:hypothetical protein